MRTPGDLKAFNVETDRRHDRRALSDEEIRWFIDATTTGPVREGLRGEDRTMLYRLALGTGFRRDELKSLTPGSFSLDTDPPTVTILASYSKRRWQDVQPIRPDLAACWLPG